ncbi:hypothetical protein ACVNPS_01480 [Candidatus Bipolaricaulota sp. J31]
MRKFLFGLLCVALFGGSLNAGVSVSPVITEMVLPPGSSYEGKLAVTNTDDVPVIIEAYVRGFTAPRGTPLILDPARDDYPYSGRDLLEVEPDHLEVGPKEVVYFDYKVRMPEELDPYGGRYVAVVFKIRPAVSEAQVVTAAQVASLFLLSPGGDVAPHFALKSAEVLQDPADPRRVILKAVIANDGNLHINAGQVCAMIHVLDDDGYIIDRIPVRTHTMLPGTAYTHVEYWLVPEDLPSGTYQFHLSVALFAPVGRQPQHFFYILPLELTF